MRILRNLRSMQSSLWLNSNRQKEVFHGLFFFYFIFLRTEVTRFTSIMVSSIIYTENSSISSRVKSKWYYEGEEITMKLYLIIGLIYGTFSLVISILVGILKDTKNFDIFDWIGCIIGFAVCYLLWPASLVYGCLKAIKEIKESK